MREPSYVCPALNRVLKYCANIKVRTNDRQTKSELEKIEREIERIRTRVSNLRNWGQHYKEKVGEK